MKTIKKIIRLRPFSFLLPIPLLVFFLSCSSSDNEVNEEVEAMESIDEMEPIEDLESSYEIYRDINVVYFENNRLDTNIGYYENNKRVLDSIFDGNLEFSSKIVRYYNGDGLQSRFIQFSNFNDTIADRQIEYENNRISKINQFRKFNNDETRWFNVDVTYSSDTISLAIEENVGLGNREIFYFLNDDGIIYQEVNGQIVTEITYDGILPKTKSYNNTSFSEQITFQYLQNPIPKIAWSSKRKNQFGSFNNQIISGFIGGLYQIDLLVDLEKYLESFDDYSFTYDFNDAYLPTRIEKINDQYKFIDLIEYQKL